MSEKTTRRGGRRGQSEAKQVKRQKLDHNSNTQVVQPMQTPITNPLGPFQPVSHSSMADFGYFQTPFFIDGYQPNFPTQSAYSFGGHQENYLRLASLNSGYQNNALAARSHQSHFQPASLNNYMRYTPAFNTQAVNENTQSSQPCSLNGSQSTIPKFTHCGQSSVNEASKLSDEFKFYKLNFNKASPGIDIDPTLPQPTQAWNRRFCMPPNLDEGKLRHPHTFKSMRNYLEAAGLNDVFWEHLYQQTNKRRLERLEQKAIPAEIMDHDPSPTESHDAVPAIPVATRGRPGDKHNRAGYLKKLGKPIQIEDLKNYIAVLLIMGIAKFQNQYSYFLTPTNLHTDPRGCQWVYQRMTSWKFYFIHSCVDFDARFLESHLPQITKSYIPALTIAADETMTPSKSRINPHHMFVRCKPQPNGILSTSCADKNGVLLSLQPRRRIEEDWEPLCVESKHDTEFNRSDFTPTSKKKMKELILNLSDYPEGSCVIVDKLYGGLDLVESLARKKVFCVAKCRADRPSWLFSKYLHKFIRSKNAQLGDYAVASGVVMTEDKQQIPFFAYSIVSEVSKGVTIDNFISTSPEHNADSIKIKNIQKVETEEKDGSRVEGEKLIWQTGSIGCAYNSDAGHIDDINAQIIQAFPLFRVMRWKLKLLLTFVLGMVHNARILASLNGTAALPIEWRIEVANFLSPSKALPSKCKLIQVAGRLNRPRCRLCSLYHNKSDHKATRICVACQVPMCPKCFDSLEHREFVKSPEGIRAAWKAKYLDLVPT